MQVSTLLLVNGRWLRGSGGVVHNRNPFNGETVAEVRLASKDQMDEAIRAARHAFLTFRRLPAHKRIDMLLGASELLARRREEIARVITLENGKPLKSARAEVSRAVSTFRLTALEYSRLHGEVISTDMVPRSEGRFGFYLRKPIGVVGAITPFNFPLNLAVHKVAPALAVGNSVVLKPSSKTPVTAQLLGEVLVEAGFPEGTVNVVPCSNEIAGILVASDDVAMVSFTGSLAVGRTIRDAAGLKRVTLELGSNSGNIVCESADLDQAANSCVVGAYTYAGQVCISVQRIYVQRSVTDAFLALFLPRVASLNVGDPMDERTDVGPLIDEEAARRVGQWLREATDEGAEILQGGTLKGTLMQPTVLTQVRRHMKVMCEELFAPLVCVIPYDRFEEAVAGVNDSRYGLNAGVFTNDLKEVFQAISDLEVGAVMVNDSSAYRADNMPYGGVKSSGLGREGARFAMEEMTEVKVGIVRLPGA